MGDRSRGNLRPGDATGRRFVQMKIGRATMRLVCPRRTSGAPTCATAPTSRASSPDSRTAATVSLHRGRARSDVRCLRMKNSAAAATSGTECNPALGALETVREASGAGGRRGTRLFLDASVLGWAAAAYDTLLRRAHAHCVRAVRPARASLLLSRVYLSLRRSETR